MADGYTDDIGSAVALPLNDWDSPPLSNTQAGIEVKAGFAAGQDVATGVVKIGTTPVARCVHAYDRLTGQYIASTRSAGDGTFEFPALDSAREYVFMALDDVPGAQYNAVVADRVRPVQV